MKYIRLPMLLLSLTLLSVFTLTGCTTSTTAIPEPTSTEIPLTDVAFETRMVFHTDGSYTYYDYDLGFSIDIPSGWEYEVHYYEDSGHYSRWFDSPCMPLPEIMAPCSRLVLERLDQTFESVDEMRADANDTQMMYPVTARVMREIDIDGITALWVHIEDKEHALRDVYIPHEHSTISVGGAGQVSDLDPIISTIRWLED